MAKLPVRSRRSLSVVFFFFAVAFLPGSVRAGKTHLGVGPNLIAKIETEDIPNDNSAGHPFRFDREGDPFVVPPGFSFVVTDVIVHNFGPPNPTDVFLVVVDLGGRLYTTEFFGTQTHHDALTGGYVVTEGAVPDARNTPTSTAHCQVEMLGYFVKGKGTPGGSSPFPPAQ